MALSLTIGIATATFLNLYVLDDSVTRFLRNGKKYSIYFVDNSSLFPTVENISKLVNNMKLLQKVRDHVFKA